MDEVRLPDEIANHSLAAVSAATISQLEHEDIALEALYETLFITNRELALWLRRRAVALAPDLYNREATTRLALELIALLTNQSTIDSLSPRYTLVNRERQPTSPQEDTTRPNQ